jgi:hypothetical protein
MLRLKVLFIVHGTRNRMHDPIIQIINFATTKIDSPFVLI